MSEWDCRSVGANVDSRGECRTNKVGDAVCPYLFHDVPGVAHDVQQNFQGLPDRFIVIDGSDRRFLRHLPNPLRLLLAA